ncbi:MAG: DUF2064 domain-containing protein [Betaproteobacteria bacterium]|nr:DUF2064 domain-containing protein [Betaproteobacteria bacterium]
MQPALAIFARTPQRSAAKTRLAEQTCRTDAERLYELSLRCLAETGRALLAEGWQVTWAVAESGGEQDEYWQQTGIAAFSSGAGALGSRLAHTYARLLGDTAVAVMIGSDSPQLSVPRLQQAAQAAERSSLAAGPAADGGFYVFAGSRPIDAGVWEAVSYSQSDTLEQLCRAIGSEVAMLAPEPDFDDLDSLAEVVLQMPKPASATQQQFCQLAKRLLAKD